MTESRKLLEEFAPNTEFTDHFDLFCKVVDQLIAEAVIITEGEE